MAALPALGKPAVSTPRTLALAEMQQVVGNIRERLGLLDNFVLALGGSTARGLVSGVQALNTLSAQLLAIEQTVATLGLAVAGIDAPADDAQSAYLSAAVHELRKSIDDINKGVLA